MTSSGVAPKRFIAPVGGSNISQVGINTSRFPRDVRQGPTGITQFISMNILSSLSNQKPISVGAAEINVLEMLKTPSAVHKDILVIVGLDDSIRNAMLFNCMDISLSKLPVSDMKLYNMYSFIVVRAAGQRQNNVYANTNITFNFVKGFESDNRQSSLVIPGPVIEQYLRATSQLGHIDLFPDADANDEQYEVYLRKVANELIAGIQHQCSLSASSLGMGVKQMFAEAQRRMSMEVAKVLALHEFRTDLALHTGEDRHRYGIDGCTALTGTTEHEQQQYQTLMRRTVELDHDSIFHLDRDPSGFLFNIAQAARSMKIVDGIVNSQHDGKINGTIEVTMYMFMSEAVYDTLIRHNVTSKLPVQHGTFQSNNVILRKPLTAYIREPDIQVIKLVHLNEAPIDPAPPLGLEKDLAGLDPNTTNDVKLGFASKTLTDYGRKSLQHQSEDFEETVYTDRNKYVTNRLQLNARVPYVVFDGKAIAIDVQPFSQDNCNDMISTRVMITSVVQYAFNHDLSIGDAWLHSAINRHPTKYAGSPRDLFGTRQVVSNTAGLNAQCIKFGDREAMYAFMQPNFHDCTGNTAAMNQMLGTALRLDSAAANVLFIKHKLNDLLDIAEDADNLYELYWSSADYCGKPTTPQSAEALSKLMEVEFHPKFKRTVILKKLPSGETRREFGCSLRQIVAEIPGYVMPMAVTEDRANQLLATMTEDIPNVHNYCVRLREIFNDSRVTFEFSSNNTKGLLPELASSHHDEVEKKKLATETEDLLAKVIASVLRAYISMYGTTIRQGDLKEHNYLMDSDLPRWRILALAVMPSIVPSAVEYKIDNTKNEPIVSFTVNINRTNAFEQLKILPFHRCAFGTIQNVASGSKMLSIKKIAAIKMLFDYINPCALATSIKANITPPWQIRWVKRDRIVSEDVILAAPKHMSAIMTAGEIDATMKSTTDKTIHTKFTCDAQIGTNAFDYGAVLYQSVLTSRAIDKNCCKADGSPRLSLDKFTRSPAGTLEGRLAQLQSTYLDTVGCTQIAETFRSIASENDLSPYGQSINGVRSNAEEFVALIEPHSQPTNRPVPIMGIPLYTLNVCDTNPWQQQCLQNPTQTTNPWFSQFGSYLWMEYVPDKTTISDVPNNRFSLTTLCRSHPRAIISSTTAMLEQLADLNNSIRAADYSSGEKQVYANMRLHATNCGSSNSVDIQGKPFLRTNHNPQIGEHDFATKMGMCTPTTQYTDEQLYEALQKHIDIGKREPNSNQAIPIILPGGSISFNETRGNKSYCCRSTYSGNTLPFKV